MPTIDALLSQGSLTPDLQRLLDTYPDPDHWDESLRSDWRETIYQYDRDLARTFIQQQTLYHMRDYSSSEIYPTAIPQHYQEISLEALNTPHMHNPVATVSVQAIDCLYAAAEIAKTGAKPLVLNMANQSHLGGGWPRGRGAQEEDVCRRTNILCTLEPSHYAGEDGFGEFSLLFSENVMVLRKGIDANYAFYTPAEQFTAYFASIAAYNLHKVRPSKAAYNAGMRKKIFTLLETALTYQCTHLVLSALGCGVFGNDPLKVARIFREILSYPRYATAFTQITFAIIPNPGSDEDNFLPFSRVFEAPLPTPGQPSVQDKPELPNPQDKPELPNPQAALAPTPIKVPEPPTAKNPSLDPRAKYYAASAILALLAIIYTATKAFAARSALRISFSFGSFLVGLQPLLVPLFIFSVFAIQFSRLWRKNQHDLSEHEEARYAISPTEYQKKPRYVLGKKAALYWGDYRRTLSPTLLGDPEVALGYKHQKAVMKNC